MGEASTVDDAGLERTVRWYPAVRAASAFSMAFIPVFFLYLSSQLPLEQVLQISALGYLSVCLLEVPSGYLSDRIGRRRTLLSAAACGAIAAILFILGGSWWVLAAAQIAFAASLSLQSGSDTALHYDALQALGRTDEYRVREARAEQWGLFALALACLSGGALGAIDLRLAYGVALIGAVVMIALLLAMVEPPTRGAAEAHFLDQLRRCLARLRDPLLAWLFVALTTLFALAHIVYEFYQAFVVDASPQLGATALPPPLLSGVLIALSMFGGSLAARLSIALHQRLGLFGLIALAGLVQFGVAAVLAAGAGLLGLLLVVLRNFPMSLVHAPVNDAIAPRVDSAQRATFLSLMSLTQRLCFSVLLFALTGSLHASALASVAALQPLMAVALGLCVLVSVGLLLTLPAARRAASG